MLVKVQFLRDGKSAGHRYTYRTELDLQVGDLVLAGNRSTAQVVETGVPEEEGQAFGDRLKSIHLKFMPDEGTIYPECLGGGQSAPFMPGEKEEVFA